MSLSNAISQVSYCDTIVLESGIPDSVFMCGIDSVIVSPNQGFSSYQWSRGDTTSNIAFEFSGKYYLTVTDDSSCIHVDSVIVSLINGQITQEDTILCFEDNMTLNAIQNSSNKMSLQFNGASSYCQFNDNSFPVGNQDRTFEAWILNVGQSGFGCVYSYGDVTNDNGFSIFIDANDSLILKINQNSYFCSEIIPQNSWTHISVSTDPSYKYVFSINGSLINSNIISGTYNTVSTGTALLGTSTSTLNSQNFDGSIDEVRIWNRYVSTGEFGLFSHLNVFSDLDLVRYWDMNYVFNNSTFDMSGNIMNMSDVLSTVVVPFGSYKFELDWGGFSNSDSISIYATESITQYLFLSDYISSCQDSIVISVVLPPQLEDSLYYCNIDTIILDAGSVFDNYLWSTGSIQPSINVTSGGMYSLQVNSSGCYFEDSTFISLIYVDILQEDTAVCFGESIVFEANSNIGDYYWITDQTTSSIEVIANQSLTYLVNSSDGYNTCTDYVTLTVYPVTDPGLEDTIVSCNNSSISVFVPGPTYPSYFWNTGDTSQILQISTPGYYSVILTDFNNCTSTDTAYVSFLDVDILQSDTILCATSQILLQSVGSPANYNWSTGDITSDILVSPTVSTIYSVTVSEGSYTCSDDITIYVASPINLVLPDSLVSCEGTSFNLDASNSGGTTFEWSNGSVLDNIDINISGLYSVTVTGDYSCQTFASTVVSIIDAYITISDTLVCEGEEVIISTNSSSYSYEWSNGSTDAIIFIYPEISANYHVFVSDNFATCHYLSYIDVINVETGLISGSISVYSDSIEVYSIIPISGSTYEWFVSGGVYTSNTGSQIEITWGNGGVGYVSVVETSVEGCIGEVVEIVVDIQDPFSINTPLINDDILVFPNPVSDIVTIVIADVAGINSLQLFDSNGRLVLQKNIRNQKIIKMSLVDLPSGIYSLRVSDLTSKLFVK